MTQELAGRVALVTGAARNIGRAIAVELGAAGAAVVINAKSSADAAQETAEAVRVAGGRAHVALADVANPKGAADVVSAAIASFGGLDILVNNAAIRRESAFADLGWEEWRAVLGVTLDAPYLCAHAALPYLKRSGAGVVINLGGMSAHAGSANRAHVIAAKAGLAGLTRALAQDLGADGVTVNCVAPGMIDTARGQSTGGTPAHHATRGTLVGRRGKPEEIASLIPLLVRAECALHHGPDHSRQRRRVSDLSVLRRSPDQAPLRS